MKKAYKLSETETMHISGNCKPIKLEYAKPFWAEDDEHVCFKWNGELYFLEDSMGFWIKTDYTKDYHGYFAFSAFAGIMYKVSEDSETVQVFYYHS